MSTRTVKKNLHLAKSVILFVTSYFINDPREIAGGISEHYVGLYGTFVKKYSKIYQIFWYSVEENALHVFDTNGNVRRLANTVMPIAILKVLAKARKSSGSNPPFTAIIAYYYSAANRLVSFLISLLLFRFLKLVGLANVIVDIIDPPVEVHVTYSETPSSKKVFLGTVLDIVTLKKGTNMWFCSDSYKNYLTQKYGIPNRRTHVIYDGNIPGTVMPKPIRAKGPLTLFYSGSLLKVKGIPQLIESVDRLRKKGIDVTLLLTVGARPPRFFHTELKDKPWIQSLIIDDWLKWIKILSEQADICIIPYPKRIHWNLTFHMKLPDYMAAGKPIVSMYGKETAYILKKYRCGLIANDWEEFEEHITTLYKDRQLAKTLGDNGRKAVEEFFNYVNLANTLHETIQKYIKAP